MSSTSIVKDSVALLMPCAGDVNPKVLQFALTLTTYAGMNGYPIRQVGITNRTLVHTARNVLAENFLKTDCEWAFWMDSDMVLETRTIPVMMSWAKKLDAKFLTGIYYQRIGKHSPLAMVRIPGREYRNEFELSAIIPGKEINVPIKVDACGFGCVLMHRSIFDKLERPFFKYMTIEQDGKLVDFSEDFYFCKKVKEAGIDLFAIPELDCKHLGEPPLINRDDFERVNADELKERENAVTDGQELGQGFESVRLRAGIYDKVPDCGCDTARL